MVNYALVVRYLHDFESENNVSVVYFIVAADEASVICKFTTGQIKSILEYVFTNPYVANLNNLHKTAFGKKRKKGRCM